MLEKFLSIMLFGKYLIFDIIYLHKIYSTNASKP